MSLIIDTVLGILAAGGPGAVVDKATSATGGAIRRQLNEHELRKKVESQLSEYCQGVQETLGTEQEFDVEGLLNGSKDLIDSAKECSVGRDREVKERQYFAKGYSIAGIDSKKRNPTLDAILTSLLNVIQENSGHALTIKAVDEILLHMDRFATKEDFKNLGNQIKTLPLTVVTSEHPADFTRYYEDVEKRFTSKKRGNYKKLVGEYSDEEAYIEAYLSSDEKGVSVLSYLEKWFYEENSETMLIYGEPGHGKSTLCDKAVVEYIRGNFLKDKVKNVIVVSLNTGDNRRIINDKEVDIEAALSWDGGKNIFTFEDCRGALLFMDGFDEFIDDAKKADITNIVSFMKRLDTIAFKYDIHIVVLSRTIAVNDYLNERAIKEKCFNLMPITKEQQDEWLEEHNEYDDYQETFKSIRNNKEMSDLLGIPFLFRMIVNSRFDKFTSNVMELYDRLTDHLLGKRNICEINDKEQVVSGFCELAYSIYCNDTDTVTVPEKQWDTRWIFAFYFKQISKRVIGFFHRSFYQYFLAKYVYFQILNTVTDQQAEKFIGAFAERELDDTVRHYLSLMINGNSRETIFNNFKLVIEALVRTEAYLSLEPRYPAGNAEKSKLGRTINIYRNTLHICAAFSYVIEKPFRAGIDVFLRTYPSEFITICSTKNNRADLSNTNLCFANLSYVNLRGADLSGASMFGADLGGADLSGAILNGTNLNETDLRNTDLSGADLRGARLIESFLLITQLEGANLSGASLDRTYLRQANLSKANLSRTILTKNDLSEANLSGANLSEANLSEANLSEANLSEADLSRADLSGANLSRADLSGANLSEANLSGANLSRANLSGANLSWADLNGVNLRYANLSRTDLRRAAFGNVDRAVKIDRAYIDLDAKQLIDSSIEGYETIEWTEHPFSLYRLYRT